MAAPIATMASVTGLIAALKNPSDFPPAALNASNPPFPPLNAVANSVVNT